MAAIRRPPRVTTTRSSASGSASSASSASISALSDVEVERRAGSPRPSAEPLEVLVEREGVAAVELDHLEGAVAAQQPVVEDRDRRLARVGLISPSTLASQRMPSRPRLSDLDRVARIRGRWIEGGRVELRSLDLCSGAHGVRSLRRSGMVAFIVLVLVLLARAYPGSGADLRRLEADPRLRDRVQLEEDDVQQMIAAQNALPAQARAPRS